MAVIADLHFPKTKQSRKQYNTSKKPRISNAILKSIKTQNKLFRKFLKYKSDKSYEIYKGYRNVVTHTKKAAKVMYYQKLIENSRAPSDTLTAVNNIIRRTKQKSSLPNSLQVNNRNLNDLFTICHEIIATLDINWPQTLKLLDNTTQPCFLVKQYQTHSV